MFSSGQQLGLYLSRGKIHPRLINGTLQLLNLGQDPITHFMTSLFGFCQLGCHGFWFLKHKNVTQEDSTNAFASPAGKKKLTK